MSRVCKVMQSVTSASVLNLSLRLGKLLLEKLRMFYCLKLLGAGRTDPTGGFVVI